MKQIDVVKAFVQEGQEAVGTNIESTRGTLLSQGVVISFIREGYVFMTDERHSTGVTKVQNLLREVSTKLVECPQDRFEIVSKDRGKASEVIQAFNKLEGATQIYIK